MLVVLPYRLADRDPPLLLNSQLGPRWLSPFTIRPNFHSLRLPGLNCGTFVLVNDEGCGTGEMIDGTGARFIVKRSSKEKHARRED